MKLLFFFLSLTYIFPAQAYMDRLERSSQELRKQSLMTSLSVSQTTCKIVPKTVEYRIHRTQEWLDNHADFLQSLRNANPGAQLTDEDNPSGDRQVLISGPCADVLNIFEPLVAKIVEEIDTALAEDKKSFEASLTASEQEIYETCLKDPTSERSMSLSFRAGWLHRWLNDFVEMTRKLYKDLKVEDHWTYTLVDRELTLVMTGECQKTFDAFMETKEIIRQQIEE